MRKRFLLLALAVLVGLIACQPYPTGTSVVVMNTNTQTQNPGSPAASPAPGSSNITLPPGSFLVLGVYGEDCGNGLVEAGTEGDNEVRIGCVARLTCTPKDAQGAPIPKTIHGPKPDFFVLQSGFAEFSQDPDEPWNARAKPDTGPSSTYSCGIAGLHDEVTIIHVPS